MVYGNDERYRILIRERVAKILYSLRTYNTQASGIPNSKFKYIYRYIGYIIERKQATWCSRLNDDDPFIMMPSWYIKH